MKIILGISNEALFPNVIQHTVFYILILFKNNDSFIM